MKIENADSVFAYSLIPEKDIGKLFRIIEFLSFCAGEYEGYDEPKDIISEQMIQSFKLSTNELLVCNEMSIGNLITDHQEYRTELKNFKKVVTGYCRELGYI